jgi:hypothetical protein
MTNLLEASNQLRRRRSRRQDHAARAQRVRNSLQVRGLIGIRDDLAWKA